MGVDEEYANRASRAAGGAFRAGDGQVRNEQLAQNAGRCVSVDASRI
jgi:hypothetical protein